MFRNLSSDVNEECCHLAAAGLDMFDMSDPVMRAGLVLLE